MRQFSPMRTPSPMTAPASMRGSRADLRVVADHCARADRSRPSPSFTCRADDCRWDGHPPRAERLAEAWPRAQTTAAAGRLQQLHLGAGSVAFEAARRQHHRARCAGQRLLCRGRILGEQQLRGLSRVRASSPGRSAIPDSPCASLPPSSSISSSQTSYTARSLNDHSQ